jgi:hypothetical protein
MKRLDALREVGLFVQNHRHLFAGLPTDSQGKPDTTEIRKLLAINAELSIALAALLATIYWSIKFDASLDADNSFERRG